MPKPIYLLKGPNLNLQGSPEPRDPAEMRVTVIRDLSPKAVAGFLSSASASA